MQGLTADAAMSMRALDPCHIWVYYIPDLIISSLASSSAFPLAITGTGVQRHALLRAQSNSRGCTWLAILGGAACNKWVFAICGLNTTLAYFVGATIG